MQGGQDEVAGASSTKSVSVLADTTGQPPWAGLVWGVLESSLELPGILRFRNPKPEV